MFSRLSSLFTDPVSFLKSLLFTLPAVLVGLTVHEWAHAFAADRLGDPTAKNLGRMTLNPLAHIDPFGFLCLILVGFGWAKPVPVNTRNFKHFRRDDIIVSLAGITMNLIVAFLSTVLFIAGAVYWGLYANEAFTSIMQAMISINLALAVFNLIPLYPLDGSHVAESLLMRKIPQVFLFLRKYGQYFLIALLLTGALSSVLGTVVNWIYGGFQSAAVWILGLGA